MKTQIKVSGNIISELSEKIPTNIIALNELIKNSYDAGAKNVTIELNTKEKLLRVIDDGSGMSEKDINVLFHISKSNKKHGTKNEYGRTTQGSKGLGFLSVFKFGKQVEWKTKKIKGIKFSVNYDNLIKADDISRFSIELFADSSIQEGTEIIINIDKYNANSLKKYFLQETNYRKVINSFDDNNFTIRLIIDNKPLCSTNDKIQLLDNENKYQIFYITYNSRTQEIKIKHGEHIIATEFYHFPFKHFSLDIELLVFYFKSHGKKKIDKLFFNPNDDLTPLIFFNSNLFNNYTIFDPNIMRNIKTTQVLNQMIGFIRILSKNSLIDFNSDRSQFLQNEKTDNIKDFLYEINRKIQEIGSEKKNYYMTFDFLMKKEIPSDYFNSDDYEKYRKIIKNDFIYKDKVDIEVQADKVIYSLFGKKTALDIKKDVSFNLTDTNQEKRPVPARIVLNCDGKLEMTVPSEQIDLKDYIDCIYNSNGELVDNSKLIILIDGIKQEHSILYAVTEPCEKIIHYVYNDSITGQEIKEIKVIFYKTASYITTNKLNSLFTIPASKDYVINFSQYLDKLIDQINKLQLNKNMEIISCSLRVLFELSIDGINKSKKYSLIFKGINDLDNKVIKIIKYIKNKKSYISEIANKTRIEYSSLVKLLSIDDYKRVIEKTHLGSHKATMYITETDIHDIIKHLTIFIILANEMINNTNIT
jgi:DNA-binding MarR family transcriptional regulator